MFFNLKPFVDYAVIQKDNKMILIIGHAEAEHLNQINIAHAQWFIKILEKHTPKSFINVIYNMSEDTLKLIQECSESDIQIPQTFLYLAAQALKFDGSNNILLSAFDCIDKSSQILNDFFSNPCFFREDLSFKEWKAIKRTWLTNINRSRFFITQSQFLDSLKIKQEKIQQWRDLHQQDSLEYILYEELLLKHKNTSMNLSKYFDENYDEDIRLTILSLLNDKSIPELQKKHRILAQDFCLATDFIFTDLSFLNEIFNKLKQSNKMIVIVPWSRKKNLVQMLSKMGYAITSQFSAIEYIDLDHHAKIQLQGYKDLPNKLLAELYTMLDVEKKSIEKDMVQTIKQSELTQICSCCGTIGSIQNKLLTCSRCKQALYCNTKCQKQDWTRHKQECKNIPIDNGL